MTPSDTNTSRAALAVHNEPSPAPFIEPILHTQSEPSNVALPNPTPDSHFTPKTPQETSPNPNPCSDPLLPHPSPHPMITRSKNHITKPKTPTDGTIRYPLPKALLAVASGSLSVPEPICFTMAVKSREWRHAMNIEFDALLRNHTWTLVPSHPSQNLIGCKWVFRVKRKADDTVERHKARLVAKGFH
jgi:hypothetical protein